MEIDKLIQEHNTWRIINQLAQQVKLLHSWNLTSQKFLFVLFLCEYMKKIVDNIYQRITMNYSDYFSDHTKVEYFLPDFYSRNTKRVSDI